MPFTPPTIQRFAENSWLVQFRRGIDLEVNRQVQQLAQWLREHHGHIFQQIIPAYDSLLLQCCWQDLSKKGDAFFDQSIEKLVQDWIGLACNNDEQLIPPGLIIEIPVCYDICLGNDLEEMAAGTGLSVEEIVSIHASTSYHVYLMGFLPGFAYMGKVDKRIALPRKEQPVATRGGAVGIAGEQTGIYPLDSPGGWNIVGHTPIRLFDPERESPTTIQAGMQVRFCPISFQAYIEIKQS